MGGAETGQGIVNRDTAEGEREGPKSEEKEKSRRREPGGKG